MLRTALESIAGQTLDRTHYEVLVVDNGSTDATREVAGRYADGVAGFRYLFEGEPGLHAGRHRGMLESRGDILVFTDDDVEVTPDWLQAIAQSFEDPRVALVGGNNYPLFEVTPPPWLVRLWRASRVAGARALGALSILEIDGPPGPLNPELVWGCNFSIRKNVLLDAGGFHPDSMPADLIRFRGDGETHVSRHVARAGMACMFHPGASVGHRVLEERMRPEYFRQRGFNQGVSDSFTSLRGQDVAQPGSSGKVRRLWHLARNWSRDLLLWDAAARHVLRQFRAGYRDGYAFHQEIYRTDPEVRAWVHRDRYF